MGICTINTQRQRHERAKDRDIDREGEREQETDRQREREIRKHAKHLIADHKTHLLLLLISSSI